MKNKIFSKGLYFEGLRQLKMIGIITSVILCVFSAAIPIMQGISWMNAISGPNEHFSREIIGGVLANPFLFAVFLLMAPLMTLVLFGFLNKRRTSDFYHSIPHTRLSVFTSFIAAILTWIAIMILSSTLAAVIPYLVFSRFFIVLYSDLLIFMLNSFVISLLAVGATAIAVSITGTPFTNFLFTAMILFLPRILISVINSMMIMQTPILSSGYSFFLFENGYNLYTTVFIGFFSLSSSKLFSFYLSIGTGTFYTLSLGLIYLALAGWLFVGRRSESAERSAPSRLLQHVYRILVTSAFCMIPCLLIFSVGTDGYGFDPGDIFGLVVIYILALILYFVYELITTRKWKNLLRAMPGLGIVLLCNIAIIGGLYGIRSYHLAFTPEADEITGVSVIYGDERSYYYYELHYDDYVNSQLSEIVLDSPEAKQIIAEGLANTVDVLKQGGRNAYWDYGMGFGYYDEYDQFHEIESLYEMTFRIQTGGGSRVRKIKLSQKSIDTLSEMLLANEQYYDLWTHIPDPAVYDLRFHSNDSTTLSLLSDENQKLFARTLQNEVAAMEHSVWKDLATDGHYSYWWDNDDIIGSVEYPIRKGSDVSYYTIPISYGRMPQTASLFLKLYSESQEKVDTILDKLKSANEKNVYVDYAIYVCCPEDGTFTKYVAENAYNATQIAEFLASKAKSGPIEEGNTFVYIDLGHYMSGYDENGNYFSTAYEMYRAFFAISDVTAEELKEIGFYGISDDKYPPYSEPYYEDDVIFD